MAARETKPIWTTSTFLVYTGGLTVLGGAAAGLAYLHGHYGKGAETGWALLFLVILYGIAQALRLRDRPIAAGIFAFSSVIAWAALVLLAFRWWGWHPFRGSLGDWSWSRMLFWLLVLASAWDDRRRFRFPFIRLISAVVGWLFVIDLISSGGNWTATVTLFVGLFYLAVGNVTDRPSAFWLHLVGGALIGGAIVYWCHTTDGDFAVISIVATAFVLIAYWTRRSSWAFWGVVGYFVATTHYLVGSPTSIGTGLVEGRGPGISPWSPALAFGILGFFLVALGMLGRRRRHAPVVVTPVAPAPE